MSINKRTSPIDSKGPSSLQRRDSRGSIVLEAALVMPVFIIVIFFFIYMVQMTVISNQMQIVASNSVKQVSSHIYPVALAISAISNDEKEDTEKSKEDSGSGWKMPSLSLTEWAEQYADALPEPISDWIRAAARKGDEPLQNLKNNVLESVLDPVIKPLLHPFVTDTKLNENRLHVSRVIVPDFKSGRTPYFGLEISYELPIRMPFTQKPIRLQAKAVERLWIGDTNELDQGGGDGENAEGQPAVILSKPEPAYAGHRALVAALIKPGTTAKLTVYYKSGVSQAKYLGDATANEEGKVEWNWLVGGNTTPGTWTFIIETEDGLQTTAQFDVESPRK
ncbi:pilus assembly protein [Paenibacillus sp. D2_2]|uniref:pilus assembly protein n=1 Tax=Paenibacillus sp. D2_2 TaxID=3073092 RepID=UPI0028155415|nr:pilus assembly protein [Paenibacillus sp. D2_2]WMT39938.1 pilus assembly protein [Paenibacillus sp. D2_2]